MMPEELFVRSLYEAMRDYLFLSVVVSLIIMALIVLLSLRMTAFTHDFTEGLQKFGKGDLTVKLPPYRDADLNHISNTFNQMTERINFLVEDGYKKQLLIQQMDIEFLQSQMNPHFLFNTLFTISTRAKMSGDDLLFEMVQALTRLLQASLHTKNDIKITVAQELEYINAYLYIQKVRYGSKLEYAVSTGSPEILTLLIPRLCIQPLVENAVVHGSSPYPLPAILISRWSSKRTLCGSPSPITAWASILPKHLTAPPLRAIPTISRCRIFRNASA